MANTNIVAPSKLDRFNACPLKFRKDEYEPRDESSVLQRMGIDKHRLFEKLFKGEKLSDKEKNLASEILVPMYNEIGLFKSKGTTQAVEEKFLIDCGDSAIHGIKDLVNRVDDRVLVIDWKTGKKYYRKSEVENSLQGKIYALSEFKRNPDVELVLFRIVMTEHKSVIEVKYHREYLEELETEVKLAVEFFKSCYELQKFPARPGSHCGYCKHIHNCKHNILVNDEFKVGAVDTDKEFATAVKQMITTEKYIKQLKEMLEEYAKNKTGADNEANIGDVYVKVDVKHEERLSSSKKAKKVLSEYQDKLGMKVDTSIAKVRKMSKEDQEKLKELGVLSTKVRETVKYTVNGG